MYSTCDFCYRVTVCRPSDLGHQYMNFTVVSSGCFTVGCWGGGCLCISKYNHYFDSLSDESFSHYSIH